MKIPDNLTTSEKSYIIQMLRFNISMEKEDWFITDFKVEKSDKIYIKLLTAGVHKDSNRKTIYHTEMWGTSEAYELPNYKSWAREYKISQINDESIDTFTYEQNIKLDLLRIQSHFDSNKSKLISRSKSEEEYINSFKVGDRITYKNMRGFITYKHTGDEPKFTINIKDTYYKYVPGIHIFKREKQDLSNVVVPDDIKKLSTHELLSKLKRSQKTGCSPQILKAELQKREHIKNKVTTKIYGSK